MWGLQAVLFTNRRTFAVCDNISNHNRVSYVTIKLYHNHIFGYKNAGATLSVHDTQIPLVNYNPPPSGRWYGMMCKGQTIHKSG